jgi:hypothetical protein
MVKEMSGKSMCGTDIEGPHVSMFYPLLHWSAEEIPHDHFHGLQELGYELNGVSIGGIVKSSPIIPCIKPSRQECSDGPY